MRRARAVVACLLPIAAVLAAAADYPSEIAQWRRQREASLRRDGGWLTVTGLFWLHEGVNRFGTSAGNDIVLPAGPAEAGVFELRKGKVEAKSGGNTREVRADTDEFVQVGRLRLYVIKI